MLHFLSPHLDAVLDPSAVMSSEERGCGAAAVWLVIRHMDTIGVRKFPEDKTLAVCRVAPCGQSQGSHHSFLVHTGAAEASHKLLQPATRGPIWY